MANRESSYYRVAIIGIGHRGYKTHFLSIYGSPSECVIAVCDADEKRLSEFSLKHPDVPAFARVEELLANHTPDFALVCLPHHAYGHCLSLLSKAGVHILKEKPAANNVEEWKQLSKLPVKIGVTFQKRFEPRYQQLLSLLPMLGRIVSVRAVLARNIQNLDSSWRASGVGVTEDLGVHMLDILVWLFGPPSTLTSLKADEVRPFQTYAGEDVADISLCWAQRSIIGNVHLSRVAHADSESVVITGTSGTAILDDKKVSLLGPDGITLLSIQDESSKKTTVRRMIRGFGDYIKDKSETYPCTLEGHYDTVITSDAAMKSQTYGMSETVKLSPQAEVHFEWPVITPKIEKATIEQMHSTLSIYNRSGIYEVFENRWKDLHGLKHALVCSSGTIAILHMFEALDLQPGDEILCPVYTFFATATPMLQYGAVPVFCDSLKDGNMDPNEILKRVTPKTKAVIVTHMWGLPCRMREIVANARSVNGGIKVLEDCSHAHTATIDGKMVGTWGDMAAWSLQAKKNITGGQAGVFATNSTEYFAHAVSHGHFNKRAKQEVPQDHRLRKFWLTGLGLNLRAHPLAIAMANVQLDGHRLAQTYREKYAKQLISGLKNIPFLTMPAITTQPKVKHAWYAFVMQFDASRAPKGLTREKFVQKLQDMAGLSEVDIPNSTGLLHDLPLFTNTAEAIPRFGTPGPWKKAQETSEFPNALSFYNTAIKLPVWTSASDEAMVKKYITGFQQVAWEAFAEGGGASRSRGKFEKEMALARL
ncbi:PLP-dependent transferase [Periconia macrospinosa]|uniref:PLP-dependent transferase n=1 Tax=Periconia macrospinosa TaxID=97972 RepID=A0A2V1D2N8_9PLEO|nr:PLP-dependent transferase [Periconia macrospinosa]